MASAGQQLYGMIRAVQMISLSALVNAVYPPHTQIFFNITIAFADLDVFNGEGYFEDYLDLQETPPLN